MKRCTVQKDGNEWVAYETATFENLQESPVGYGATPMDALYGLLKVVDKMNRYVNACEIPGYKINIPAHLTNNQCEGTFQIVEDGQLLCSICKMNIKDVTNPIHKDVLARFLAKSRADGDIYTVSLNGLSPDKPDCIEGLSKKQAWEVIEKVNRMLDLIRRPGMTVVAARKAIEEGLAVKQRQEDADIITYDGCTKEYCYHKPHGDLYPENYVVRSDKFFVYDMSAKDFDIVERPEWAEGASDA